MRNWKVPQTCTKSHPKDHWSLRTDCHWDFPTCCTEKLLSSYQNPEFCRHELCYHSKSRSVNNCHLRLIPSLWSMLRKFLYFSFQRAYRSMILMIQNLWTVPQVLRLHLIPHQSHWKHGLHNYAVKSQFRLSSYGMQWVWSLTQEELCTLQDWGVIFERCEQKSDMDLLLIYNVILILNFHIFFFPQDKDWTKPLNFSTKTSRNQRITFVSAWRRFCRSKGPKSEGYLEYPNT